MVQKGLWVTYVLWYFGGFLDLRKFYLGKIGWGVLDILTGGLFLVGILIDLFTIPSQVREYSQNLHSGV